MAPPKYNPLDIATQLIPKRWLDTPMISYNDAEDEYQKLQQQTTQADNAQTISKKNKNDLEAEQDLADNIQKTREAKIAAGGDGSMTDDEMYAIINDAYLKHGQGAEVARNLLAKGELDRRKAEDEIEKKKKKLVSISPYNNVWEEDYQGNRTKIQTAKERPDKIEIPIKVFNPNTMEEHIANNKAEREALYHLGFTEQVPGMDRGTYDLTVRNLKASKKEAEANKPSSSKVSEDKPEKSDKAPIDYRLPPGSRILRDPTTKKKLVLHPDGSTEPFPF